jgi:ABC-type polysaccharide/polyol phosphate transport system ATPase subunit
VASPILRAMQRPIAIEVRDLAKGFPVPGQRRPMTVRSRLRRPLGRGPGRRLEVFSGLDFEVEQGEFFGIVGRNGCGKSTLLKLLASVYKVDRGRVRLAGRLAPFLELGVGFNPRLTARDNVVVNGVMMGLSPAEARRRFDEIIDFAGLRDYVDLPIKNYSSGMRVRLGFAVMTHVDADVLLIDEVLAVGDAEFQGRCEETFEDMHRRGRTIVLVTHSMPIVTQYCERAMLLHEGAIDTVGAPDLVAERYYEVNLSAILERPDHNLPEMSSKVVAAIGNPHARITEAGLVGPDRTPTASLEDGEPIHLRAQVRVEREFPDPSIRFQILGNDGREWFRSGHTDLAEGEPAAQPGELEVFARLENRLPPGRYTIIADVFTGIESPAGPTKIGRFEIVGADRGGRLLLDHEVEVHTPRGAAR